MKQKSKVDDLVSRSQRVLIDQRASISRRVSTTLSTSQRVLIDQRASISRRASTTLETPSHHCIIHILAFGVIVFFITVNYIRPRPKVYPENVRRSIYNQSTSIPYPPKDFSLICPPEEENYDQMCEEICNQSFCCYSSCLTEMYYQCVQYMPYCDRFLLNKFPLYQDYSLTQYPPPKAPDNLKYVCTHFAEEKSKQRSCISMCAAAVCCHYNKTSKLSQRTKKNKLLEGDVTVDERTPKNQSLSEVDVTVNETTPENQSHSEVDVTVNETTPANRSRVEDEMVRLLRGINDCYDDYPELCKEYLPCHDI